MNITDIEVIPCELMDRYDIALRELHKTILSRVGYDTAIRHHQTVVLKIRNEIAERLNNTEGKEFTNE